MKLLPVPGHKTLFLAILALSSSINAGALGMMNAYTVFDGVPCNFNKYLLTDILSKDMGFRGQLVTDWTTLKFSITEGAATDLVPETMFFR